MKIQYLLYMVLFIGIYGLLNYYIGRRGWQTIGSRFPRSWAKGYWIIFWIAAFSYVIAMAGVQFIPGTVSEILDIIGSYWMAAILYLLLTIAVIDIIRILLKLFKKFPSNFSNNPNIAFLTGILVIFLVAGILAYGTWNSRRTHIKHYDIDIAKKADTLKQLHVAMVSDIHLGKVVNKKRLAKMVEGINRLNPDIILIAGDILDSSLEPFANENMGEEFKKLKSKYGVYAALGNHDYFSGSMEEKVSLFNDAGINVLRDNAVKIGETFYLAGREDKSSVRRKLGGERKSLESVLGNVDKSLPVILLDHQPVNLSEAVGQGVDLQLSGHTHQGQLFPIDLITNKVFEVDYGYLRKENTHFIVTSGYGTWGPPIRVGISGEIVDITINFK
ncbi:MAG: metallophosphoesterase [Clostridia bacterium]|nr:metallophosphoesterase [Clostridia bacterium]